MRTYSASQFKTHALSIIDAVDQTGESVIVTKRGKPMVQVVPIKKDEKKVFPGHLRGTLVHMGDVITPFGPEIWEAAADDPPR